MGKFQDGLGATTCEDCPSGRAQPGAGADKCDECQVISFFLTMTLTVVPVSDICRTLGHTPQRNTDGKVHAKIRLVCMRTLRKSIHHIIYWCYYLRCM